MARWIFGIASIGTLIAAPLTARHQMKWYSTHSVSYYPTHVEIVDISGRLKIFDYTEVSHLAPYTPSRWSFAPKIGWHVISHSGVRLAIVLKPIPTAPLIQGQFIPYLHGKKTWRISVSDRIC